MKKQGRSRSPRPDVRELLIESARKTFAEFGFRKTTVDDVARAARKGKSSVYHYFSSKEEIFEAVLEREARLFRSEIGAAVAAKTSARERLEAYVIARMRTFKGLVNFYRAFREGYQDDYPVVEKFRQSYDREETAFIASLLRLGVERSEFSIRDLDTTAVAVVTAMKGLEFRLGSVADEGKMVRMIRDLLDVLFYGIVVR